MKKLIIIFMILILCGCKDNSKYNSQYEYVDTLGNKGIAKDCWLSYGGLFCDLKDEMRIEVISYKEVK